MFGPKSAFQDSTHSTESTYQSAIVVEYASRLRQHQLKNLTSHTWAEEWRGEESKGGRPTSELPPPRSRAESRARPRCEASSRNAPIPEILKIWNWSADELALDDCSDSTECRDARTNVEATWRVHCSKTVTEKYWNKLCWLVSLCRIDRVWDSDSGCGSKLHFLW